MPPFMSSFNVSIAAIPVYYAVGLYCHAYAQSMVVKVDPERKLLDNRNPRNDADEPIRKALGPKYSVYQKAKAAHNNCNETLPLFAAAMLAGNFAGMDPKVLNIIGASVVVLRVVYSISYMKAKTRKQSYFRSAAWASAILMKFYVFGKAAVLSAAERR